MGERTMNIFENLNKTLPLVYRISIFVFRKPELLWITLSGMHLSGYFLNILWIRC